MNQVEKQAFDAMRDALYSIRRYGLDTLSGRMDGPDDRNWQREAVKEMTKRASTAISEIKSIQYTQAGDGKKIAEKLKGLMFSAGGALTGEVSVTSEAWRKACAYIDHICIGLDSPPRTDSLTWEEAEKICNVPLVDDAIRNLLSDQTGDNATAMIQVIVEAAHSAQGNCQ